VWAGFSGCHLAAHALRRGLLCPWTALPLDLLMYLFITNAYTTTAGHHVLDEAERSMQFSLYTLHLSV